MSVSMPVATAPKRINPPACPPTGGRRVKIRRPSLHDFLAETQIKPAAAGKSVLASKPAAENLHCYQVIDPDGVLIRECYAPEDLPTGIQHLLLEGWYVLKPVYS